MLRDSKDYLWISTTLGLDRYDSDRFVKYRYNPEQPGTISSNTVRSIFEDKKGQLWFGTTNGLNLYNRAKDAFETFKNIPTDTTSLNGNSITSIIEDKDGNLWVLTDGNCLNKLVPETRSFIRYKFDNILGDTTVVRQTIKMIAIDSQGYFWIASYGRGISRFETEFGIITKFDDPSFDFGKVCLKNLYIDSQDKIWIATEGNGFFSYEPEHNEFKHFISKPDGQGPDKNLIYDIIPDGDRYLLLAVNQGGINRFDKVTETFEYIKKDATHSNGLNSDGIWCLYRDKENILWIGTSTGGINVYNPKKQNFKLFGANVNNSKSLSFNSVLCLYEDFSGLIWIGTDGGGVNVYNPETSDFTVYTHKASDPYTISGNAILSITEDKDHDMWIGTWDAGLNRFDRKTGKFYRYSPGNSPTGLSTRSFWSLGVDYKNNIWMGGNHSGVDVLNKNNGIIQKFRPDPANPETMTISQAWQFIEDPDTNMWIGTANGLYMYNKNTGSFKAFKFPDNAVNAFLFDKEGNLWVGSASSGLYYCKPDGTILKTYTTKEGLSDNVISGIIEAGNNKLWITTSNGLSMLNTKTQQFRNYSKEDGLQANIFHRQSFLKTLKGEIYIGGFNGFNSFWPDSLKDNDFIPPVYITDFQIFNKPVVYGGTDAQFPTHISEAKEISLTWRQSVFLFSFNAINYTYPGKNQYSYILEGFETEWNFTNVSRRYVTYTNLDPGEYTFRVKASNNDGLWNNEGASIHIIILPPCWSTWWFRVIFVLAVILIVTYLFISRIGYLKRQRILLEKLVANKTIELQEKNDILEDRQHQIEEQSEELLSQQESLLEMNALLNEMNVSKDKFFSIIAHDLKNPFNTIIGFSELLKEEIKLGDTSIISDYAGMINASAVQTLMLLENLLEWANSQRGKIMFTPVTINLSELLNDELGMLSEMALKKNILLKCRIPEYLTLAADKNMLKTILRNLISNAIKFTQKNGSVEVQAKVDNNQVEISVADNGIGMSKETLTKLFKIENNVSTRGTENEKGTGLGLLLCKEFVEKHGGVLLTESEQGEGSTFTFTVPKDLTSPLTN